MHNDSVNFMKMLESYGMTYTQFLDLKDEWDKLSWSDRNKMLNDAINRDVAQSGEV